MLVVNYTFVILKTIRADEKKTVYELHHKLDFGIVSQFHSYSKLSPVACGNMSHQNK